MPNFNRKKIISALTLCIILVSTVAIWQLSVPRTQAALIQPYHQGLVGWWQFDEGNGATAVDSSGNGNNGIISGATWVTGKFNNALNFESSDTLKYVQVPDSQQNSPSSQITVSCWIYATQLKNTGLIWKSNYNYVLYSESDGKPAFFVFDSSGGLSAAIASNALPLNTWTQVVGVLGLDNKARIYINGVQSGNTGNSIANIRDQSGDLFIGKRGDNIGVSFSGSIDDVQIYNRTLTTSEIQESYNYGPDVSSNIIAKVPRGTTQVMTTISWSGTGNINATIISPAQNYTESMLPEYQKSSYSTSNGITNILNVKRLSVTISPLASDETWHIALTFDNIDAYQITMETQK